MKNIIQIILLFMGFAVFIACEKEDPEDANEE